MLSTWLSVTCLSAWAQTPPQPPAPAPAAASGPVTYELDPQKSWLYVVVYNDPQGMASRFGHDHGIRAMDFDGKVVWDAADPSKCQVDISFPVTALQPDPPGMRERAGLPADGAVGASSLETIRGNFLGKSQLDAENHPNISYRATKCEGTGGSGGGSSVKVTGDLTIRGVTKPVPVTLQVKADPTSFSASGSFTTTHTAFGFKPYSNLGGALRNKDELKFVLDMVGKPAL
jgi:polyisoprenoid-binding protein YceI